MCVKDIFGTNRNGQMTEITAFLTSSLLIFFDQLWRRQSLFTGIVLFLLKAFRVLTFMKNVGPQGNIWTKKST